MLYKGNWKANYPTMLFNDFVEVNSFLNFEFKNIFGEELDWIWDESGNVYFGGTNKKEKYEGKGVCKYKLGYVYRGFFSDGMWTKQGELYADYGKVYTGQFFKASFEGKGTMYFRDGRKYIGRFHKGEMQGEGKMIYQDGKIEEGFYKESLMHGKGTVTFPDLSCLEGIYEKGKLQGRAVFVKRHDQYEDYYLRVYKDGEMISEKQTSKKPKLKKTFCCFF